MQRIIEAEKIDLFDVLAHVAYALAPVTRAVRAANSRVYVSTQFSPKHRVFPDFVLTHYVEVGRRGAGPGEADAAAAALVI